jgi:LPXTG-motif cell wall-anchored protein
LGAVVASLLPTAATAKGPSEATITGPGISVVTPIVFRGDGEGNPSTDLGLLVTESGFFPQTFGQSPNPLLRSRPSSQLATKYTVTYTVPGPSTDTLRQELYPYAAGGPLSYMEPGQRIWDQQTHGGWFRGTSELRRRLVAAGLPRADPEAGRKSAGSRTGSRKVSIALATGIALTGGAFLLLRRRR